MEKIKLDITVIIVVAIAIAVGFFAPKLTKKNDSPTEQYAEKVIKDETGVDYDFSPDDAPKA